MKKNFLVVIIVVMIIVVLSLYVEGASNPASGISGHWKFCNRSTERSKGSCGDTFYFKIQQTKNAITIVDECSKNGPVIKNVILNGNKISFDWTYFDSKAKYEGTINGDVMGDYAKNKENWTWKAVKTEEAPTDECNQFHILLKKGS